jgi:hypothetical protein
MDLKEFSSPLPKPWLDINADTVNCRVLQTNGLDCSGAYNPNLANVSNLNSITLANSAQFLRIGNIVIVSGSFTATISMGVAGVAFSIDLPASSPSILNSHRSGFASCMRESIVGFPVLSLNTIVNNTTQNITLNLVTDGSTVIPGGPATACVFYYQVMYEAN